MIRLAKRFGLSDNGLRKICRRLEVPCPPAGFWAKKAAGKKVAAVSLPPAQSNTPASTIIAATPAETGELRQAIRERAVAIGEIAVPKRLASPHPIIAGWLEDHRRRKEEARRHREQWPGSSWAAVDHTDTDRRRHRILHALFNALQRNGVTVAEDDRPQLYAGIGAERMRFACREKQRQTTRPLTADEKRWGFWDRSGVRQELVPTGRLEFTIHVWLDQPFRRTWLESEDRPLDGMLPGIVATFLIIAPLLADRTRRREEEARAFAERQRLAELERQRREADDRRWTRFLQLASDWQRAELARAFIGRLRQLEAPESEPVDGRSLGEWLDWAEARADAADPLGHGAGELFGEVAKVNAWTRLD